MEIYVAHPDDIDAIAEIARASWEADYPNILNRESAVNEWYSREQLEEELTYPWTYMYVAAEGGEVIGLAHAVLAENEGNILRIYVHPDERRRGIGRALFDRIRHELIRHDIERLNAMVLSDNALGNEFYADLGMEHDERAETIIDDERFEEDTYVLELT